MLDQQNSALKLKLNISRNLRLIQVSNRCGVSRVVSQNNFFLVFLFMLLLFITLVTVLRLLSVGQSGIQSASEVRLLFELRLTLREFFPSLGGSTCRIDWRRRSICELRRLPVLLPSPSSFLLVDKTTHVGNNGHVGC